MYTRLDRAHRALAVVLGAGTLVGSAALLVWDAEPGLFAARAHAWVEAGALGLIAVAYLVYQSAHRPPAREWVKAILLAVAFLSWAGNQVWADARQATLLNDVAIALFVLDVFLVMIGRPATSPDESFAETHVE